MGAVRFLYILLRENLYDKNITISYSKLYLNMKNFKAIQCIFFFKNLAISTVLWYNKAIKFNDHKAACQSNIALRLHAFRFLGACIFYA